MSGLQQLMPYSEIKWKKKSWMKWLVITFLRVDLGFLWEVCCAKEMCSNLIERVRTSKNFIVANIPREREREIFIINHKFNFNKYLKLILNT